MPVKLKDVRAALEPDEPNYALAARQLGPEALPHLETLVTSGDPHIASKAASLAGMIASEGVAAVLEKAARSSDPRVRIAAAGAARHQEAAVASDILVPLVQDADPGVRKTALKSMPAEPTEALKSAVRDVSQDAGAHPAILRMARDIVQRLPGGSGLTGDMPTGTMDAPAAGTAGNPSSMPNTKGGRASSQPATTPGGMPAGRMNKSEGRAGGK